jgi:hypothetical protein
MIASSQASLGSLETQIARFSSIPLVTHQAIWSQTARMEAAVEAVSMQIVQATLRGFRKGMCWSQITL